MAIDCPDGFTPQFKTRPVYPPIHYNHNPFHSSTSASSSTSSTSGKSGIIKPLLSILANKTSQSCVSKTAVDDKMERNSDTHLVVSNTSQNNTNTNNNPLSCSFSSIQFIDDDAKSRSNLNDTAAAAAALMMTTTPLVHNNKENLLQIELSGLLNESNNTNEMVRPSLGKRLFEKQQQKMLNTSSSNDYLKPKWVNYI